MKFFVHAWMGGGLATANLAGGRRYVIVYLDPLFAARCGTGIARASNINKPVMTMEVEAKTPDYLIARIHSLGDLPPDIEFVFSGSPLVVDLAEQLLGRSL
jgi:hypothetical protein